MTATETLPQPGIGELADPLRTTTPYARHSIGERPRAASMPALLGAVRPTISDERGGWADGRAARVRGAVTEQRRYADHRPYPEPPARLADLTGPTAGVIVLPITIDWGPKRSYDMGRDADRRVVYEVVLQEAADANEVARYVNGAVLVEVWPRLFLPRRVRDRWEARFPELTRAA